MKLFGNARIKLMAAYTGIIMLISISFSVVIASIANQEINRPFDRVMPTVNRVIDNDAMNNIFQQRIDDINFRITIALIMVNMIILIAGSVSSYFLAKWTLRPIEKAMEDQARFVGDASHELRTPLAAIAMENEVMLREKKPTAKELRDQVKSNLDEIEKLRDLTNYLLELNQSEEMPLANADLASIVAEAVGSNSKQAAAKHITLDIDVKPQSIITNASALAEIISIIINNAVKYSPEQSTIMVRGDQTALKIIDQGSGIGASDLPHIFDRFYRAESSRTSEGYGLGLSLAQHLAKRIGVSITANNNQGQGAIFTVTFSVKSQL